jgi:chromosome segregation ATPase
MGDQSSTKDRLRDALRKTRIRVSLPFFAYEVKLDDVLNPANAESRIAKLDAIKQDLEAAVVAVGELRTEAEARKAEADTLRSTVAQLENERKTAEEMLKLPEEALTGLLSRAGSRGRTRGIIEGLLIGLLTGGISSYAVWYFTK